MKDRTKINDEWAIVRFDSLNYALMQTKERLHPVKKTLSTKETIAGYYSSKLSALRAYTHKAVDNCQDIKEICNYVDNVIANIKHITEEK